MDNIIKKLDHELKGWKKLQFEQKVLTTQMLERITYMVNTGKLTTMPEADSSSPAGLRKQASNKPLVSIYFTEQEIDKDDPDADQTQRGQVVVVFGDKPGIAAAQAYSKENGNGDPGDCFSEWAQGTGFPPDMWGAVGGVCGLGFAQDDDEGFSPAGGSVLNKYSVDYVFFTCPDPNNYDYNDKKDEGMFVVFFFKSQA